MKTLIALLFISLSYSLFSETTIFGLEIGRTTEKELKEKYPVTSAGINKWTHGDMYNIPVQNIALEGLQQVLTIFDEENILVGVIADFPKDKFQYLNKLLTEKYTLTSSNIPFVGSKFVKFQDGLTGISIESPHLSLQMTMTYCHKVFLDIYSKNNQELTSQKEQTEKSLI